MSLGFFIGSYFLMSKLFRVVPVLAISAKMKFSICFTLDLSPFERTVEGFFYPFYEFLNKEFLYFGP